uniref:Uncharacterized protein n=1 Tax=Panagrolaimus superbus TaxID=310955 RepID=A0A914Y355_9BILA
MLLVNSKSSLENCVIQNCFIILILACSVCTGHICKVGGKNTLGSACTEDVSKICKQNWGDSKLESIA